MHWGSYEIQIALHAQSYLNPKYQSIYERVQVRGRSYYHYLTPNLDLELFVYWTTSSRIGFYMVSVIQRNRITDEGILYSFMAQLISWSMSLDHNYTEAMKVHFSGTDIYLRGVSAKMFRTRLILLHSGVSTHAETLREIIHGVFLSCSKPVDQMIRRVQRLTRCNIYRSVRGLLYLLGETELPHVNYLKHQYNVHWYLRY